MGANIKINLKNYDIESQKKPVFMAFAVNDGSNLIARKGTKLDARLIQQCLRRNIVELTVFHKEISEEADGLAMKQNLPVPKSIASFGLDKVENFSKFADSFVTGTHKLSGHFDTIKKTGKVDEMAVYKLFQDMVDVVPVKSDLLKYTHFLKTHDDITYAHSQKVAILCNMLGNWMNLPKNELEVVTLAGLLHDIGKTELNVQILRKKDKLSDAEFAQLKQHTKLGFELIGSELKDPRVAHLVLDHHERVDGSGYNGKKAEELNRHVNILMLCDIYAALTSNRPYKKAMDPFFAIKYLTLSERTKLDPEVMYHFLLHIANQYIGSRVKLTDNSEWDIVTINNADVTKPLLKNDDGEFMSLLDNKSLDILALV